MISPEVLVRAALRDGLSDLRDYYELLAPLADEERRRLVNDLRQEHDACLSAFESSDTVAAVDRLIQFLYVTLFAWDAYPCTEWALRGRQEFYAAMSRSSVDAVPRPRAADSPEAFAGLMWSILRRSEKYQWSELLCRKYARPLPAVGETSDVWLKRCGVDVAELERHFDDRERQASRGWWFAASRLAEVKAQRVAEVEACRAYADGLRACWEGLADAAERLGTLCRPVLSLSVRLSNLERVYEAIASGVALKHLLLEEAVADARILARLRL